MVGAACSGPGKFPGKLWPWLSALHRCHWSRLRSWIWGRRGLLAPLACPAAATFTPAFQISGGYDAGGATPAPCLGRTPENLRCPSGGAFELRVLEIRRLHRVILFLRSLFLGFGFGILWLPGYALPLWVSLPGCGCSNCALLRQGQH